VPMGVFGWCVPPRLALIAVLKQVVAGLL
jgi:hypothetical protein